MQEAVKSLQQKNEAVKSRRNISRTCQTEQHVVNMLLTYVNCHPDFEFHSSHLLQSVVIIFILQLNLPQPMLTQTHLLNLFCDLHLKSKMCSGKCCNLAMNKLCTNKKNETRYELSVCPTATAMSRTASPIQ